MPRILRGIGGLLLIVTIIATVLVFWIHFEPQGFSEWKREAGPLPFFAALALLPAVGVPPTPFFILAGATFSGWVNLFGITLALAFNVALSYAIVHSVLRGWIERLATRARLRLPTPQPHHALRYAILIKLAPGVPMFLKNYLVGMCGVSFPQYFAVCFGISAAYAAVFVYLGESLSEPRLGNILVALGLVLVLILLFWLLRRRFGGEVVAAGGTLPAPLVTDQLEAGAEAGSGDAPSAGTTTRVETTPSRQPGRDRHTS